MTVDNNQGVVERTRWTTATIYKGVLDPEPETGQQRGVRSRQQERQRRRRSIIEHPVAAGVEALRHAEANGNDARRCIASRALASANKVTTLKVKEEYAQNETIVMLSVDLEQLIAYSRRGEIPKVVRDAMAKAIQHAAGDRRCRTRHQRARAADRRDHGRTEPDSRKHEDRRAEHAILRTTPRRS